MASSLRIARIRGIDINIHFTWLIIFGLLAWSVAESLFPGYFPQWSGTQRWQAGIIASLLLFISVIVHELCHSLVAQSRGMEVSNITLFAFGGVSMMKGEARRPSDEFLMAVAGPAASVGLAILFGVAWKVLEPLNEFAAAIAAYLAVLNVALVAFNMIPGFPLDGGRVLRAALWGASGDLRGATRAASVIGQIVAFTMIFAGLMAIISGQGLLNGMWIILIGWFLNNAAENSYRQLVLQERLRGYHARDIMVQDFEVVQPDLTLRRFVEEYVLRHNQRAFPVLDDGHLLGLMTLTDLKHVPQEKWDQLTVKHMMTGLTKLQTVRSDDELQRVLESLGDGDINQMPVVDNGRLVGMVTRSNLINFLRVREELRLRP